MQYTFNKHDYLIFLISYVFFFLYIAQSLALLSIPGLEALPSWIYLIVAVVLNVWVLPLSLIHI